MSGTTPEGQHHDHKSLRKVVGSRADWNELAHDCVCFANGSGGRILLGIEDDAGAPPPDQRIDPTLPDRIRKRVGELTVNVEVHPALHQHDNGGEYVVLTVPRSVGVASTSDGRYFVRVGDTCKPVTGDDVLRLANERPSVPWEVMVAIDAPPIASHAASAARFGAALRSSERVKSTVKEKTDAEILHHYGLARDGVLTNLGVLLVGTAGERARLGTAPIVQAIRYDARGDKIGKYLWDDHELSPIEILDAVWSTVPDFRETYELPDGMFRTTIPAFEEAVVRELLVNALVHRPYTQRGDIYLNLHPDRLEVVNPGPLPLGVTPHNILHASRRRNDALAKVFHDLGLMEREGSGFDLMFERLLVSGRGAPTVREGTDSVHVTIPRRVLHPNVSGLVAVADERFQLTQRERIALALLSSTEGMSAPELAAHLDLGDPGALRSWTGRLLELGLVHTTGRTRATRYFVPPPLLREVGLDLQTTLARIQPHRLRALILEDLERFPDSPISDTHRRVGPEIPMRSFHRAMKALLESGDVAAEGQRRWRRYRLRPSIGQGDDDGR